MMGFSHHEVIDVSTLIFKHSQIPTVLSDSCLKLLKPF